MIDYLYVNNYRSLVNFRIDFGRTSVLMGNNGSGKTSVMVVLAVLRNIMVNSAKIPDVLYSTFLTKWMNSSIQTFEIGISQKNDRFTYFLEVEYDGTWGQGFVRSESVKYNGQVILEARGGNVVVYNDQLQQKFSFQTNPAMSALGFVMDSPDTQYLTLFKKMIAEWVIIMPDPKRMEGIAVKEMPVPDVQFTNFASVYAFLTQSRPEIITKIWDQIRMVDPSFSKTRIDMGILGKEFLSYYKYQDIEAVYRLSELSEGERLLFMLYMLLYGYIEQGVPVFIDEPDNYVSLREIQPWCSAVQMACEEGGQCVLISHHPEVIDYFAGDSGIWLSRLQSGVSTVKGHFGENLPQNDFLKYSEMIVGGYLDEVS